MTETLQAHASVVLRPTYRQLRSLLAIAAIAIVALSIAVAVLAANDGTGPAATRATNVDRSRLTVAAAHVTSNARALPQVGPNPDQRDLVSGGGTFAPGGPNPDQATP